MENLTVTMSLSDVIELCNAIKDYPRLKSELDMIKGQLQGLRNLYYDCLEELANLKDK